MSRQHCNSPKLYRAVVVIAYGDRDVETVHLGPYTAASHARAAITRERGRWWRGAEITGHIEQCEAKWEPVG